MGTPRGEWRRWLTKMLAEANPSGCWEWPFTKNKRGYGQVTIDGRKDMAHRVIFRLINETAIPPGLEILHDCDNPPCVDPRHLLIGTHRQNMRDMIARGRHRAPVGEAASNVKLTADDVRFIRSSDSSARQLSDALGVSAAQIYLIRQGKSWRHPLKPI